MAALRCQSGWPSGNQSRSQILQRSFGSVASNCFDGTAVLPRPHHGCRAPSNCSLWMCTRRVWVMVTELMHCRQRLVETVAPCDCCFPSEKPNWLGAKPANFSFGFFEVCVSSKHPQPAVGADAEVFVSVRHRFSLRCQRIPPNALASGGRKPGPSGGLSRRLASGGRRAGCRFGRARWPRCGGSRAR